VFDLFARTKEVVDQRQYATQYGHADGCVCGYDHHRQRVLSVRLGNVDEVRVPSPEPETNAAPIPAMMRRRNSGLASD
jgi:hypothetical protein